ncbi:hypothetical protein QIX46_19625 [Lysinibacillus boronitolerans]|nr:hypothetical protein QIX46_19625 [Lysinibacillus boronitolerans]
MKMQALEDKIHAVRSEVNRAIQNLANEAINDSTTYAQAVDKLKAFRWKMNGETANFMLDAAIKKIEKEAMLEKCKRSED